MDDSILESAITQQPADFFEQNESSEAADIMFSAKAQKDTFLGGLGKEVKSTPPLEDVLGHVRSYGDPKLKGDYEGRPHASQVESTFQDSEGNTRVTFIGTMHDRDPQSSQIARILSDLEQFKKNTAPQSGVVFVEGGGGRYRDNLYGNAQMAEVIQIAGEMGAVTKSAQDSGYEVSSPDPSVAEISQVLKESGIPAEQIALFYFSKNIYSDFMRHRSMFLQGTNRNLTPAEAAQVQQLDADEVFNSLIGICESTGWNEQNLKNLQAQWAGAQANPDQLEQLKKSFVDTALVTLNAEMIGVGGKELFNENYQSQYDPEELYSFYTPYENRTIFNKLSRLSGDFRDQMFTKAVYDARQQGKNVFMVAGDDHEFKCRPALQYLFGQEHSQTVYMS